MERGCCGELLPSKPLSLSGGEAEGIAQAKIAGKSTVLAFLVVLPSKTGSQS